MIYINITVRAKKARAEERARVVCGNSDYTVRFDFDEEWAEYAVKTARFVTENGNYTDVQFEGSDCPVPILRNTRTLLVGVFAGNLRTTTAALIHAVPCITDPDGTPADPTPDVYAQLMERLNELEAPAAVLYTEQNLTDEQKAQARDNIGVNESLGITGATVGQIVKIKTVDSSGVPTEWEPADMPSGGSGTDTSLGISGATVGQTVKIKAVDENGIPTEWEAVEAGKSAYQYAQEGGYTGTEAEFAAKLAAEMPESYTLPIASAETLGGVQPVAQTAGMTQPVGVDADGKLFAPSAGGKWTSIGTVTAKNDGEALVVDGFSAERIRITAMLAAVADNRGLRFFISESMFDKQFTVGMSLTTSLRPITFEMQIVGEYAVTSAFILPKSAISINAQNQMYIGGVQLPDGETTLKRFGVTSANDKLIAGSWLQIEVWQQ